VTWKVAPETLMAPLLAGPVLAVTENPIVPLPLPLAPDEIVIQFPSGTAVQLHVDAVVAVMAGPAPAVEGSAADVGDNEIAHPPA
jgi:hypothetical protein